MNSAHPLMTPKRFLKLCAKRNGASDVADALGASPGLLHAADGTGNTGLHRAAAAGCVETAVLLVDSGLAVDVRNTKGKVPMHEAALFGHVGVCEALVLHGSAAVRWAVGHSSEQWTPLMYAASRGHCATIAFLIDAGAAVEPGPLTATLDDYQSRTLSRDKVVRLLGETDAEWIISHVEPSVSRRLTVCADAPATARTTARRRGPRSAFG